MTTLAMNIILQPSRNYLIQKIKISAAKYHFRIIKQVTRWWCRLQGLFFFLLNWTSQPWICQSVTFSFPHAFPILPAHLSLCPKCRAGTRFSRWLILTLSSITLRQINGLSLILWLNISVCHPITRGLEVVDIYSIMYIYKIYIYIYIYSQRSYFDSICIQRSATTLKPLTAGVNYTGDGRSAAIKNKPLQTTRAPSVTSSQRHSPRLLGTFLWAAGCPQLSVLPAV